MEELMKEAIQVLRLIAGSLSIIATCLWFMLFCKDMGHRTATELRRRDDK